MKEVELLRLARQLLRVGKSGALVRRGEARDGERRLHRVPDRARREIGGARVAFLLAAPLRTVTVWP